MKYLKDLLITDRFLLKGHVDTGNQRLSNFLNDAGRHFIEMNEAALLIHEGGERISVPRMLLRTDEILIAHEIGDAGDEGMKALAERQKDDLDVANRFSRLPSLQLSGKVRKRAMNAGALYQNHFVVVVEPQITGLPLREASEYALMETVYYVIVNTHRIAFVTR